MPNPRQLSVPAMPAVAATMKLATVATTVKSAVTMESTTTESVTAAVEPSSTMEAAAVPKAFMIESSFSETVMVPATPAEVPAFVIAAAIVATTVKARTSIKPVIPRACADEHATDEPFRAVVAIWRTSVGVIIIVAVGTYGRWANISRAHSHAHNHSLRARKRSAKEANAE